MVDEVRIQNCERGIAIIASSYHFASTWIIVPDLSGGQDGAVQLWEWGHASPVCTLRLPGTHAKVTSCCFNSQGNKLGVTDGDGFISLWQASAARTDQMPFFVSSL